MKDLHNQTTATIRQCQQCEAGVLDQDKFCRRCGARQVKEETVSETELSAQTTMPLAESDPYRIVSGPLVDAVKAGLSLRAPSILCNRFVRYIIVTLISIPVWIMILLLSPLDAYEAARSLSSQVVSK